MPTKTAIRRAGKTRQADFLVQSYAEGDVAFVCDPTGQKIVAIIETVRPACLPRLPAPLYHERVLYGDHVVVDSWHVRDSLAGWINRCRDQDARLSAGPPELRAWWDHGCNRLTSVGVRQWLEV